MNLLIDKTLGFFHEEVTITFAFQGGEPTVAGLDYFRRFILKRSVFIISNMPYRPMPPY